MRFRTPKRPPSPNNANLLPVYRGESRSFDQAGIVAAAEVPFAITVRHTLLAIDRPHGNKEVFVRHLPRRQIHEEDIT